MDGIFTSLSGQVIGDEDIFNALIAVGADDCDTLYAHTSLTFGTPNPNSGRQGILESVLSPFLKLRVRNICFPTYTFSFCNNEIYDPKSSKSQMGALNEYVRKLPEAARSHDPLMSVTLLGADLDLVSDLGNDSIGEGSTFDKLHRRSGVKFAFFGVDLGACFTYMHYLEWLAKVPYRYSRGFQGLIVEKDNLEMVKQNLFVRYANVKPNLASYDYERLLEARGILQRVRLGDSQISVVSLEQAEEVYLELLDHDINSFISEPFDFERADDSFVYGPMQAL